MRQLIPFTISLLALAACGSDPKTTATDSASETTSPGSSTGPATSDPGTTATSDPNPTTSGASDSATGTTATTTTDSTGPATSATTTDTTGAATSEPGSTGTTDPGSTGAIMDCAALEAAFAAETKKIRSCTKNAECGQDLQGTSCGCTRNWVARNDADTTHFYELIDQGAALQCELIPASTCDCPAAEGFACDQGICTWNYL